MNLWTGGPVMRLTDEALHEALETLLATYLTDGHHNGITLGVRGIDPIIFRHLADMHLIKTAFPVRGTGDTWCLGAYMPKILSELALNSLEGHGKPHLRIREETLQQLNLKRIMRWIVEYEGCIYINFWGENMMMLIVVCQYEDVTTKLPAVPSGPRRRLSVRATAKLLNSHGVSPARLWLDDIVDRYISGGANQCGFKMVKSYQMDINDCRAAVSHNYILYTVCYRSGSSWMTLDSLTLPRTWKNLVVSIDLKAAQLYLQREISKNDLTLLKYVRGCSKTIPMKGPYNEHVLANLRLIEDLLENGVQQKRAARKQQQLRNLVSYLTERRRKSAKTLRSTLTAEERMRLGDLANHIAPLRTLLDLFCEQGTPIGRIFIHTVMYSEPN
ncbi:MAG: hypothetical protein QW815_02810 [Nitrososphaerota archaeon]